MTGPIGSRPCYPPHKRSCGSQHEEPAALDERGNAEIPLAHPAVILGGNKPEGLLQIRGKKERHCHKHGSGNGHGHTSHQNSRHELLARFAHDLPYTGKVTQRHDRGLCPAFLCNPNHVHFFRRKSPRPRLAKACTRRFKPLSPMARKYATGGSRVASCVANENLKNGCPPLCVIQQVGEHGVELQSFARRERTRRPNHGVRPPLYPGHSAPRIKNAHADLLPPTPIRPLLPESRLALKLARLSSQVSKSAYRGSISRGSSSPTDIL